MLINSAHDLAYAANVDPTPPRASLSRLAEGSLLVFYAGLKGFDFEWPPALYIVGYFEVARSRRAGSYNDAELAEMFRNNFHVMHTGVFDDQRGQAADQGLSPQRAGNGPEWPSSPKTIARHARGVRRLRRQHGHSAKPTPVGGARVRSAGGSVCEVSSMNVIVRSDHAIGRRHGGDRPKQPAAGRRGSWRRTRKG